MTDIDPLLEPVLKRLKHAQSPDGLWRTPYLGSPGHTAIGLLATLGYGAEADDAEADEALALELVDSQRADGAWAAYGQGPDSPAATRMIAAALTAASAKLNGRLGPGAAAKLDASATRANAILASHPREHDPFWALLADGAVGASGVGGVVADLLGPLTSFGAWAFLGARAFSGLRRDLSAFTEEAIPAIALLAACPRTAGPLPLRWARGVARALERPALERLARRVEQVQNPNGSWLWSVFGTALNVFALVQAGRSPRSTQVQNGLSFIRSLRVKTEAGWQQRWCNAELWDTSVAGMVLLGVGASADSIQASRIAEHFLAEQRPESIWAFGTGARRGDHDSTSIVVNFLFRVAPLLPEALSRRAFEAARAAALALLSTQQRDGGWGYSPAPNRAPYGFGRHVPFGLETAAIDASTSDVTGRVLWALGCAEAAGALAGHEGRLAGARQRGRAYFEGSQARCGSWFGRWSPGYILAANYVGPVLRALGAKESAAKLRAFLLAHQNADGGFGETPAADVDDGQAGVGTSTPIHTAYAVVGLVATSPGDSTHEDASLAKACRYLMDAAANRSLDADRPLYTVAFREDYYDAPRMTDAAVLMALRYASRAAELGADAATREWMTGKA
jgi:hypothetical protein